MKVTKKILIMAFICGVALIFKELCLNKPANSIQVNANESIKTVANKNAALLSGVNQEDTVKVITEIFNETQTDTILEDETVTDKSVFLAVDSSSDSPTKESCNVSDTDVPICGGSYTINYYLYDDAKTLLKTDTVGIATSNEDYIPLEGAIYSSGYDYVWLDDNGYEITDIYSYVNNRTAGEVLNLYLQILATGYKDVDDGNDIEDESDDDEDIPFDGGSFIINYYKDGILICSDNVIVSSSESYVPLNADDYVKGQSYNWIDSAGNVIADLKNYIENNISGKDINVYLVIENPHIDDPIPPIGGSFSITYYYEDGSLIKSEVVKLGTEIAYKPLNGKLYSGGNTYNWCDSNGNLISDIDSYINNNISGNDLLLYLHIDKTVEEPIAPSGGSYTVNYYLFDSNLTLIQTDNVSIATGNDYQAIDGSLYSNGYEYEWCDVSGMPIEDIDAYVNAANFDEVVNVYLHVYPTGYHDVADGTINPDGGSYIINYYYQDEIIHSDTVIMDGRLYIPLDGSAYSNGYEYEWLDDGNNIIEDIDKYVNVGRSGDVINVYLKINATGYNDV